MEEREKKTREDLKACAKKKLRLEAFFHHRKIIYHKLKISFQFEVTQKNGEKVLNQDNCYFRRDEFILCLLVVIVRNNYENCTKPFQLFSPFAFLHNKEKNSKEKHFDRRFFFLLLGLFIFHFLLKANEPNIIFIRVSGFSFFYLIE